MSVLDEATGTVMAGDAVGRALPRRRPLPGAAAAGHRPGRRRPEPGHAGGARARRRCAWAISARSPDPAETIALAREQLARAGEAARAAVADGRRTARIAARAGPSAAARGDRGRPGRGGAAGGGWAGPTRTSTAWPAGRRACPARGVPVKDVAVDLAVLTARGQRLSALLVRLPGSLWALPVGRRGGRGDARGRGPRRRWRSRPA